MLGISRRYAHFVYGFIQSGLTCAVATAIAALRMPAGMPAMTWISSWLIAWATMIPVVLLAAPLIRKAVDAVTRD
jgi:hypothetical protein